MTRWQWIFMQMTRRLWLRASLIGGLGVLAAILAAGAEDYIPWKLPGSISAKVIGNLLTIIASSMLTVTTFSLSTMTSAYASASSSVTPRAARILMSDTAAQNVLSTFIGSFLFSIVGLIVLDIGAYGDRGRIVLFLVTVFVIMLIVVSLLHWIDYLTRLGRMAATTQRVEEVTTRALNERLEEPYLGGRALRGAAPPGCFEVAAGQVGYVQFIDMKALSSGAGKLEADVFLQVLPGAFVHEDSVLALLTASPEDQRDAVVAQIRAAIHVSDIRSFDQDPRFGLAVLSEIAIRALSPAVNDPGTAIDVIGRQSRLLTLWARGRAIKPEDKIAHPRIHVPPLASADLFEDAFMMIARDSATMIEVQLRLQKNLAALCRLGDAAFRAAAATQSRLATGRAEMALALEADKIRLREATDLLLAAQ